jgi:UDP-3-O-[3-hydroxymyristoyl] N-acetylglucosamine deacetylase
VRIPATLASVVPQPLRLSTRLAVGEHTVATVEHLLSALEASGVDNARVEVEEATELPVLDGSAEGWVLGVRDAGVVKAKDAKGASLPRLVPKPPTHVKVSDGDAFVMFHPEPAPRLTYLVDFKAKSEAIGRQSHTWAPLEDENYAHEVARARTFTTLEDAEAAREAGLVKGGSLSNALVAEGTQFLNGPLRFSNECARHKLLDLVGDLSLLGVNGNGGLPEGHVVAYKAGHQLHVQFARALAEACGAEDYVPTVCAPLVVQPKVEADAEDDASLN